MGLCKNYKFIEENTKIPHSPSEFPPFVKGDLKRQIQKIDTGVLNKRKLNK